MQEPNVKVDKSIFRAYDIRGVYGKTLDEKIMRRIGAAVGTMMVRRGLGNEVLVGNDIRASSPNLSKAFIDGVTSMGANVTNVGTTSFGVALFSGWRLESDITVYITASHNPPEWNGVKFFDKQLVGLFEEDNKEIGRIVIENDFEPTKKGDKRGKVRRRDVSENYKAYLKKMFAFARPIKVIVDCGNGSTSMVAPEFFLSLPNLDADVIFHKADPAFPERGADVKKENMERLGRAVVEKGADIGVAFDGDGDRLGVVNERGEFVEPDRVMIVLGKKLLENGGGDIVVNVESSMIIEKILEPFGGNILRIPVGHTFMGQNVIEHNAVFGGEPSAHYVIPSYLPFDDAVTSSLKIIEILSHTNQTLSELVSEIPVYPKDRIAVDCDDNKKFNVVENLKLRLSDRYDKVNTLDGVRIDLPEGWALIRASNTSPKIRLTVEATDEVELERIKSEFLVELNSEIERIKTLSGAE
jgi:phosphomannomutase/phosphoglucomutase